MQNSVAEAKMCIVFPCKVVGTNLGYFKIEKMVHAQKFLYYLGNSQAYKDKTFSKLLHTNYHMRVSLCKGLYGLQEQHAEIRRLKIKLKAETAFIKF